MEIDPKRVPDRSLIYAKYVTSGPVFMSKFIFSDFL
jgi:hypothetical protein